MVHEAMHAIKRRLTKSMQADLKSASYALALSDLFICFICCGCPLYERKKDAAEEEGKKSKKQIKKTSHVVLMGENLLLIYLPVMKSRCCGKMRIEWFYDEKAEWFLMVKDD